METGKFKKNYSPCNNNYSISKNNINDKFNLNSLYEIEHFLCTLKNTCKCINFYKFLK